MASSKPGAVLGSLPTLLATSITVYAVGRARDQPKVSHTGMDLIQALMVSEGLVQGRKLATQRERPDGTPRSFPSRHAADTSAVTTALERHLGWKGAVPAHILASYVAMSRLRACRHWLSDVVFGSSVGIIAGRTVTRHGREFPGTVVPTLGGVAFVYVRDGRCWRCRGHVPNRWMGRTLSPPLPWPRAEPSARSDGARASTSDPLSAGGLGLAWG